MQTQDNTYQNVPDYDNSSEEAFYDMKTSDIDGSSEFDQMTEDQMPIPENCEEDEKTTKPEAYDLKSNSNKTLNNKPVEIKKKNRRGV